MSLPLNHAGREPRDLVDDEDISDGEIKMLLQRAENRMRVAATVQGPNEDVLQLHDCSYDGKIASLPKIPRLKSPALTASYVSSTNGVAHTDARRLVNDSDRKMSNQPRLVKDPMRLREEKIKEEKASAGPDWFNLPRTKLTPELKRDLQLLKMRGVLDPKRHYKKENSKAQVPEFSQVGTIVEGPTEYFSSRLPNKERKKTFVEEILGDERSTSRFKNKYNEIQVSKTSGKKAYYKSIKEKRFSGVRKQ